MKKLILLVVAIMLIFGPQSVQSAPKWQEMAEKMARAIKG